jgi:hypothetical protein
MALSSREYVRWLSWIEILRSVYRRYVNPRTRYVGVTVFRACLNLAIFGAVHNLTIPPQPVWRMFHSNYLVSLSCSTPEPGAFRP